MRKTGLPGAPEKHGFDIFSTLYVLLEALPERTVTIKPGKLRHHGSGFMHDADRSIEKQEYPPLSQTPR